MMRGILVRNFGGIDQLKVATDLPIPTPSDNQVLIKIQASGVNPVDTYICEGYFYIRPNLPYTPGFDGAGVVESVGKDVSKFKPGDRVFSCQTTQMGTLAEYSAVDQEDVFPLGEKLSFEQGSSIGIPYFTAYRALMQKALPREGDRVLIHGASGAVGLAAVQMAKAHGLHVTGTAGTQEGLDVVKANGADEVINHRDEAYIKKLTEGELFDVILEMLANINLANDLKLMKSRGRCIIIGNRGQITVDPRDLMLSEGHVIGCILLEASAEEWVELAAGVGAGIEAGWVKPPVDKVYDLEQTGQAHHDIMNSKGAKGNLVVKI